MKKIILAAVLSLSACVGTPAIAEADYTSIPCIKFIEGDWKDQKPRVIKDLLAAADKNQAMLVEDLDDNDLVVAGTNLYCENIPAKDVLTWVGL